MAHPVTILLFGPAAAAAGASEITLDIQPGMTVSELKQILTERCPAIEPFVKTGRIAVNQAFAPASTPVNPDDELALIAMVSGG